MVEITGTHAAIGIMLTLTVISMASAVYTNTFGNDSDSLQVGLNKDNAKLNFDAIKTIEAGIKSQGTDQALLQTQVDELQSNTENAIIRLDSKDRAIDAKIDERVMPTQNPGTGPSTFRLELSSQHIEVGDSFRITGFDKANTPVFATLQGPLTENVLPLANQQTRSNGEFELATFVPNSWNPGQYTLTVIIGQNFDRLVFTVHP